MEQKDHKFCISPNPNGEAEVITVIYAGRKYQEIEI
jgi:hypothetical protein